MSFKVTYDPNGATAGTVPVDSTSYTSGQSVTVQPNTGNLAKGSDEWARWNTKADGSGAPYGPLAPTTFNITANVTLFAQWYTTSGLIDLGSGPGITQHFQLHYESSLQGLGLEPARTNGLLSTGTGGKPVCENDYQIMADWFGGITLNSVYPVPLPTYVGNLGGGANVQSIITLRPGNRSDTGYLRYLYVSEITELFMDSQRKGWFAPDGSNEQSCGEALSRFLAQQFLVKTGLGFSEPGYAISPSWLNSSLPPGTPGSSQLGGQLAVLTAAVDNTVTSLPVNNAATIPFATTYIIQVENEQMLVTSVDASALTMTVTRGYNGTTAASHANKTSIQQNYGSRADYVNLTLEYDHGIDASTGCAMLFLYYLNVQLGFSVVDIIAAAPGVANAKNCLRGVYNDLTNDLGDPFPFFKQLLDASYPPNVVSNIPGPNPDNPYPLGSLTFWGAKDTWGSDEVSDIINTSGGFYPQAFWLVLEGFNKQVAGTTTPLNPVVAFPGVTVILDSANITYEVSNPFVPQRIRFPYNIIFSPSVLSAFPTTGETPAQVTSSINILGTSIPALGEFFFVAGANPYFTNVLPNPNPANENQPYLSGDLRVFTATPALNNLPVPNAPTFSNDSIQGAYDYITALVPWLNKTYGDPIKVDPFDANSNIIPGQQNALVGDSSVTPFTSKNGQKYSNYNFALARVRLRGQQGTAHAAENVKVFFRVWGTNSADSNWNPSSTYLSHTDTSGKPIWPLAPPDNHTIPFFATNNPDFTSPTNNEFGTSGVNNQKIQILQGDSQWAFFGCLLDVYDTNLIVNNVPVVQAFPGDHHCLVAEIAYTNAPIENIGSTIASPYNSDKLAQRNLQITSSDNPGPASAHRVPQTFETHFTTKARDSQQKPDELMIDWGDVPEGSVAYIYWPQVNAQDILTLASQLYSTHALSLSDANTIRCVTVKGTTYVPIPFGSGPGLAGLFTIDLPLTVVAKQVFNVLVTRITSRTIVSPPPPPVISIQSVPRHPKTLETRPAVLQVSSGTSIVKSAVGSFRVNIPVATEVDLLPPELDKLAVFKARLAAMSPQNRWYPVLQRYIGYISGRVDGLGGPGTSSSVPPSFGGSGHPPPGKGEICCTGHVTGLLFDGSGEFEGFLFVFDDDKHKPLDLIKYDHEKRPDYRIDSREPHVRKLVEHVWHENHRITICLSGSKPHVLLHIIVRDPIGKEVHGSGVFGKFKQKVAG